MNVFDLVATLRLDSSEYEEGMSSASSKLGSFGSAAASGLASAAKVTVAATTAVSGAMIAGAAQTASYGDDIDKMSQKLGISAEAYQEWDFILQHSGADIKSLQGSMKTMAKQAQANSDTFQKLGISEEEVATLSQEDLFGRVVEGLQGMEEGTERTTLATELLGRGATELGALLNTTAEDTEAMKSQVHDLGGVMSNEAVKGAAAYQDSLQNMTTVFNGLKNSLLSNFLPSMTKVMDGVSAVFSGQDGGIEMITEGIEEVITNITEKIPEFLDAGSQIVDSLVGAIVDNLPALAESAIQIITVLVSGIIDHLPEIVQSAVQIVSMLIRTIAENLPMIINAGVQLIVTLAQSLAQEAPTLIPVIIDAVILIVQTLIENAPLLLDASLTLIMALADGLIDYLPELIDKLPEIISTIVDTLVDMAPDLLTASLEIILKLAEGLITSLPDLVAKLPEIITAIVDGLTDGLADIIEVGVHLVEGLWDGIQSAKDWLKGKVEDFGNGIIDGLLDLYGIASPSKVTAEIGKYLAEGLGKGWEDEIGNVMDTINDDANIEGSISVSANTEGIDELESESIQNSEYVGLNGGDIVIPIYIGQTKLDEVLVRAEQMRNYRSGGR